MLRIVEALVEFSFWLRLFAAPFLLGLIAVVVMEALGGAQLWLEIVVLVVAGALGVVLAEYIRRKHGCSAFLSRVMATPDIPPHKEG